MKFRDYQSGRIVVIEISGKIMGGDETTRFHGRVHEYINQSLKNFVIDLGGVERMNSVGVGMLTSAFTTVSRAGGRLVLANITNIESLLTMTRLISIFPHYDSREAALESFSAHAIP